MKKEKFAIIDKATGKKLAVFDTPLAREEYITEQKNNGNEFYFPDVKIIARSGNIAYIEKYTFTEYFA